MLDLFVLAKATCVGALTAAAVMWLATRAGPRSWQRSAGWAWAIGVGVLAASGATDQWPHWPPREDRARFLTLIVPLTLLVETLAATAPSRGLAWALRLGLTAVITPILLHNSVYLADLNGRNSAEWSWPETAAILCGLAALVALVWTLIGALAARTSTSGVQWVLFVDALAATVTVTLSGYFGAGLLGLGLSGAIAGAALASHFAPPPSATGDGLAMSVIGIFAVVLMGRFFGSLSTGPAAGLLLAPLVAWIIEMPRLRRLPPAWRSAGRIACVAVPLILVVLGAQRKFAAASASHSSPFGPAEAHEPLEK
ncbi:MAG: hypothetical protein AB7O59_07945 [Pirellulales bacterium]